MRLFVVLARFKQFFLRDHRTNACAKIDSRHRLVIAITTLGVMSISALLITTTVESNLTFARKLDRFLVLPGTSESALWNNPHHALTQDVHDEGLYQSFNDDNAATLNAHILLQDTKSSEDTSVPADDGIADDTEPVNISDVGTTSEESNVSEVEDIDAPAPKIEEENESLPVVENGDDAEEVSPSPSESDTASENEPDVSETPLEAMSKSFFRFVERATGLLPFAQETIVEPVSTPETSPEPEPEPTPEVSPELELTPEVSEPESESVVEEAPQQEELIIPEEVVTEVVNEESYEDEQLENAEEDVEADSSEDALSQEGEENPETVVADIQAEPENWLVFRDFALPPMNSGQFIRNVQLRMSLAGTLKNVVEAFPQIRVEYTTGGVWEDAGSIIFDTEISNALNGGYYLFALPTFRNVSELEDFAVRISYDGDPEVLNTLFVDAVWLEVNTETFDREILNQRLNPLSFKGFKLPEMYEYIGGAIDFAREEVPKFTLKYESQRNPVVGFFRDLFGRDLIEVERVAFVLPGGAEVAVDPEVDLTEDGLLSIQLTEEDTALLTPGKYEVQITVLEGSKEYTDSFNFQWGVLAINPNQATYPVGSEALITMGAVSENGNTLCEAELQLYIFDPTGYVHDAPVQRSGFCNGNNVIDKPDYFATFSPTATGTYEMYLEHIGAQGDVVAHTYDTFMVRDTAPLTMERTGPTRINPRFEYPMSITVTAHEAFDGEFIERVPADFVISTSTDARIEDRGNSKELIWNLSLATGESHTFTYSFDAPDISPYLYNIGPARVLSGDGVVVYEVVHQESYFAQETVTEPTNLSEEPLSETPDESETVQSHEPVESETPQVESESENILPEPPAEEVEPEVSLVADTESEVTIEEIVEVFDDTQALPEDVNASTSDEESDQVLPDEATTTIDTDSSIEASKDFEEHRQWQIASDATGSALLYWSSSTIPSGWTCVSCAPAGAFYQRFVVGSSTAGTNGGATTHTHTMTAAIAATGAAGVSSLGGGGADVAQNGHTHTLTPTIGTGSNLPSYRNLVLIQHNSAGSPATIPAGAIALFDTTLPSGWSAYSAQNGFFPRAEATSTIGTTGGSNTHTHTITGTTGIPNSTTNAPGFFGVSAATNVHTHTVNGASSAGSSLPPYIGALFGQLGTTTTPTDGMILMWTDSPPVGWNTVSSSSEPFENRFVVASTTYGVTGGSATHSHANFSIVTSGPSASANRTANAANADASGAHTHSADFTSVSTVDNLPPFRTVVFAKRAPGGAPPAAVVIHTPFDNEKTGTSSILFEFTGDDPDGSDTLVYQVQWDDDSDLDTTPLGDRTSDNESGCSPDCFENIIDGGDTNPFTDNQRIRFTAPSTMVMGTTYYYRIRVKETIGDTWGSWSTVRSVVYSSGTSPSEWFQTQNYQFGLGTSTNATTTGDAVALASTTLAATPVVQSFTSNTAVPGSSLTLTKPSNVLAGDLLLIIVGNDDDTASAQWDDSTLKPSGFTLINESGSTASDAHSAAFYRVADGTESTTINVPAQSSDDYWGYYLHVTDVNPSNPINVIGSAYNGGSSGTHNVPGVTTTAANALAFYVLSGDGGDLDPYSVGGAWTEGDEIDAGTGGGNSSGTWGTRLMTSPGATGNASVTLTAADSASGFQFALAPALGQGSHQSPGVTFTSVAGQTAWGEATWNVTEPLNTDVRVRVLYSNVSACDTLVSDGVLPGNSIGFGSSQTPIDLTSLSTSTYHTICLEALLDIGSGTTSPMLDDWTVRWTRTPQFIQSNYRWYTNNDTLTPTDPWPVGGDDLNENEPIDTDSVVSPGDILRLRLSLLSTSTDAAVNSTSFKLQHGTTDTTCTAVASWYDVGGTSSTTAPWRGYNNGSVTDGATLPSTLLSASDFAETYEEQNNSYVNPAALDVGEIGEWDWTLQHNGADAGRTYCFRMVNANDDPLMAYTEYPTLITDGSPSMILYRPFDNEKTSSTTPWFEFVSDDPEGDDVDYQIQIDNDASFGSTLIDTNSISNLLDFTNLLTPSDKSPFRVAERMRYRIPSALSNGTTYWWRVRSIDAAGSGAYGEWSTARSFTIDTSVTVSTWFQTTEAQFDTDTLIGTDATGGNLIAFATGSTTGTTTSTAIDFDDVVVGNAWGEFSFNETGAANNILYHLEYFDGVNWALIPDSALTGNAAGFDTSPVNLLDLDSSVYNTIRIRANFLAGTPTILDWTIAWGERVAVPTHMTPFDNEKFSTTTPFFNFTTTDPQGDDLEYEISWSTDNTFSSGSTTRNSSLNAGFINVTSGGDTDPFNSGDTIRFQIQPADALSASTTYWWRVRAKDPGDSDSFSFWSTPWSFTTATSGEAIDVSTWFQTTDQQFSQGTLFNVSVTGGGVSIMSGIVLQSWDTNTAVPGASLSLTKPTGVAVGDLLLIIVGNDDNTGTPQWNSTTLRPSGFNLINTAGSATPDAHVAAFYRIADGTETSPTSTPAQSSDDYWGYYIHVTGVSTTSPIDAVGSDYLGGSLTTHNIPGITTIEDQALAFYAFSADGGDLDPFSVGGAWTEQAEIEAGVGAGNASGAWGTQLMASAGATGNASVTMIGADGASGFQFSLNPAVVTEGTLTSQPIDYDDGDGPAWGEFYWNDTEPAASEILYRIEYRNSVDAWELIPDGALPGNSAGFTTTAVNLESLDTTTYNAIRIVASLSCDGATCPTVNDLTVTWSSGFTVSGTAYEYDGVASTTSGTVAIAVNGVLQSGKTGTISNGLWSIPNVTFYEDDIVTVFVQGANADEAVAVTQYDGTPGISGLSLVKRHLTIGSDDLPTIANADIALYDFTNTEDVFFDVNGGNDLSLCADTNCADASLRILAGASYVPGTGGDIATHNFRNDGIFTPGSNTMRVSGSWDNNSTTTMTNATVIFTATTSDFTTDPWYDPSWGYRTKITVAASEVDADVSDFPVYVNLADLDSTFFSNVTSDGGDIRVTTSDSITELPREIVSIDTGTQEGEIYFQADSLSSSSDTVFYIYYDNPLANDYAVSGTYGRNAVWSNGYAAVYHMEEDPGGSAPQYIDSTGNSAGTAVNMASGNQVTGIAGNAAEVDGVNESIQTDFNQSMLDSTWSIFLDADGTQGACDGSMFSRGTGVNGMDVGACGNAARIGYHWENLAGTAWNWTGGPVYPTNEWFMASLVITPTQATAYAHASSGVTSGSNVQTHTTSTIDGLDFGWDSFGVSRSFDGTIDETRLSDVARSADWLATEYNNISDTAAFYDATTSESYGSIGSTTVPYTLDDVDGVLDFHNVTFGEGSGSATWSIHDTLDIENALTVAYGTLARGTEAVLVAGNLTTQANGFWTGIGTTTFDGINPSTWTDTNATKQNIGNVVVNGTSKTMILGSNVVMNSMRIETDDVFDLSTSGYTASVYRGWTNIGSFLPRTGTVAFIATSSSYVINNGPSPFYNLTFNGAGGAWSFATATLTVQNNFTIATGTVTMPTGTTTISGSFLNTGGTFAHNNANVLFNGSGSKTITQSGTAFTNAFYNVRFTGSGSWSFSEANATTTNNFTITQGAVTLPSTALSVGNSFAQTGGSFSHNNGTVRFTGLGTHTIDINSSSFNDIAFTGSGSWSFLDTSLTVLGDMLVQSGTLTMPTGTLSLGGSFTNTATVAHASGTVLFNSTDIGETINLGNSPLHHMVFSSTNGGWTITENATTTGSTTLSALSSFTLASGKVLSVAGAFINSVGGASTTWLGSTLSLESGNYSINTKLQSGDAYDTLRIGANADVRMWFSTSTTYLVSATGSLYSQDHAGVDGDLYIWGSYERTSGTEYWSYATDFDGTALGGGSRQVDVRVAENGSAGFTNATLQILGTSTATTTVARQAGGTYGLTLSNGTFNAQYYQIRNTNAAGLSISGSSTILSLAHGDFELGIDGGSLITVASTTIDHNPALQIQYVRFATSSGITSGNNVTQSDAVPASYWWFRNASGNLAGESFDNDTGNPGSIRWDDSQILITVTGTVYSDDGVTTMGAPVCDGSTHTVRIVVNGGTSYTGSCNASTGAFSIANVSFSGDPILTAYLDTNGGARGVTITKTPTGNLSNFNIYQNRVITRHEDVTPLTILDMSVFDADNDTDIPYTAATGTLSVFGNAELHIASSTIFAPGGDITIHGNASSSVTDGSLHIDNNAQLLGSGTSTYTIAGSFTMDQGGSFTYASTTVIMNATTTGKTITTSGGQEITFNTLRFTGVGGGWNINGDIRAQNGISVENGTVSGTANVTVLGGSLSGNGTVSMGGGTTTVATTNTLGGTAPWTFNNLVLGNGIIVGTTTAATNATTTILGRLTIGAAHTFSLGGAHIDLRGSGTVFVESGVFLEGTSTVRYSGTTGSQVLSTTYHNLELMALGNAPTFTGSGLGIAVLNDLTVGGATTTTFTLDTHDPVLDVNGIVRINTTGTLIGSASAAFTVGGGWDNDGTFTGSGGTVTFDGGSSSLIAAGNSSFAHVLVSGSGSFTFTEHATATGAFTLSNAGAFTIQSGQILAVGGTFLNSVGGAATTWTGSTLSLYGGGNYTINASTTSDSYNTLRVASGTQIRMWNSDASTYDIAATGSLYSQDHGNSNGELRIFGHYQKTSGTDYWSYATDFDGTSIAGSPRAVSVLIANTATVTVTGGGLSVVGGTGATTTITNQGSGTYALLVGGTASTTWSRFSIRNTNGDGLTFSGTPSVNALALGDFEVAQNGASAMTVGGTVITQNPAKTFTNIRFGTSTGVATAYNVTATGTTVSSWRFTNHAGVIAGESFDNDPTGDPGYLVWDDSAALITVSGTVYSDEGVTVSGVCDGTTQNVHVRVAGLTSYTASCNASTGAYSVPNISFGPADSIIVFINGETEKAATVTVDPVSNITNMDLYENRVIVRHENSSPISIADMDTWDSGDDADIPFTAALGAPNTLSLPADRKLIIWTNKEFEPIGNITVAGGGGGAAYDGTVELYTGATFDATGSENHTIGGSLLMAAGAVFDDETSTMTFTTSGAARTIDSNDQSFYNMVFNGSGSWTVSNTALSIGNDLTITQGTVTLPSGTTTVSGSLLNNGGIFVSSSGTMVFDSSTSEVIRPRTSSFGTLLISGNGSFTLSGGFATTTGDLRIDNGSFTSATGTLAIGGNFINNDVFAHANGTMRLTSNVATVVTASSSDLYNITFAGDGPYTFTDTNLALLGTLRIEDGAVALPAGTVSIGGSFLNTGGTFTSATGTVLFNSTDTGETVNSGLSSFHNVTFGSASGGWTITTNATSTGNFALTSASQFTVSSSTILHVGGVFTNLVGGGATTWTGSTLSIASGVGYTINSKTSGGDAYNNLIIGSSTALRAWDSSGVVSIVDGDSSFYSQDHAGVAGTLNIYGDYLRTTGTDYWSYATDFDGTALGGGSRQVSVAIANGATTTFAENASLQIVGVNGFETSVSNQGSGTYALRMLGGTFNALQYTFANMDATGLALQGTTTVSSLSEGSFTLAVNGGALISLSSTTLNYNAGLVITNTAFATTSAITGFNVALTGTTLNAWTFIGHTGNLAGEDYDSDGGDDCGSVRWEDSLCLLTQQSGYRFRADDGGAGVPNSEWLDLDWVKRMRVTFTNEDPISYSNASVAFTVTYDSDMQADFDDLRFTLADGVTPVDHFIETYSAGSEAYVWVKVPLLATSTDTSVFMYYGNGSVADGSATSTFSYLDTFEDGNISEYSGDTGLFTAGTTMNYERNRGLDADGNETQKTTDGIYRTNVTVAQGETLRYLQYIDTSLGSGDETCTLFGVQSPGSNNQNYAVCLELYGVDRVSIARDVDSNDTSGTVLASTTITYSTGWYEVEIDWDTDDSIGVTVSQDDVIVATTTVTDGTYTQGGVGFAFWFQSGGWDIYSSRPLLNTEPSFLFGAEQVSGGASWLAARNTPHTGGDIGETTRIRFLIENTGLSITDQNYEIEYAAKGASPSCEAVGAGLYVPVPPQASCGTSPICMASSTQFTNLAATVDLLGGAGAFSAGQMIEDPDNTTGDIDVATNAFTELEYAIIPTVNVVDSSYCLRVSDEGSDLDAYARVAELSLMFEPTITTLSLNGGSDIILTAGATTTITATGTVSDLNGYADLAAATTTIFRSGVGESCTADNNNCYIAAPAQCTYSNCAGASCTISCSVDMYYHSDPTDIGTYAGETWRALLSISDVGGSVATATAPSIDLLTLRALSVEDEINYGALAPNSNTGSYNATTTIQNIGNDSIDISVEGTDLTDGGASAIPVSGQRFATSTFTYSSCVVCGTLAQTATDFSVNLSKPASTTPPITDDLFWGLAIPFGVAGTAHHGTNIFYAIGDL